MKLVFHPEVIKDISKLDGNLKKFAKKALKKIKISPELGKPLANKGDIDLSGCYKIYFYKKKYRIVYGLLNDNKLFVWSIGKREDEVVYLNAYKRILETNNYEK